MAATLVSGKFIAEIFELTDRRVRQLANEGVIPKPHRGKYDLYGCVGGYVRFLETRAITDQAGGGNLRQERERLLKAKADEKELDVAIRRGVLVKIDTVVGRFTEVILACRARLLAIPTKSAPRLFGASLTEAKAILEGDIKGTLTRRLMSSTDSTSMRFALKAVLNLRRTLP